MAYDENLTISGLSTAAAAPSSRDYPIYNDDYYSGTDVSIYFGDTWVDEIVSIQFEVQEKVSPIFGYADYIYSRLAKGNRTVYGKFRINFTEAGYMQGIIDRLTKVYNTSLANTMTRESNVIDNQKIGSQSFEEFASNYEQEIWDKKDIVTDVFARGNNSPSLSAETFDILIGYGTILGSGTAQMNGYAKPSSTLQIIKNVTLTGRSQIIDTSDNGLMEEYDFIAQDVL